MTKLTDDEKLAKLRELLGNPIAEQMDTLSRDLVEQLCEVIDEITGDCVFEHDGFRGFRKAGKGEECDDFGFREATNRECADFSIEWWKRRSVVDLRKPLPNQIAKWLRAIAATAEQAAEAVEAIEDTRDLRLIRRILATKKSATGAA